MSEPVLPHEPNKSLRERALLALLIALVGLAVYFWTAPGRRADYLRRASLTELEREAMANPRDAATLQALGEKQRASGDAAQAYESLTRAADLAPSNFAVWNAAADLADTLHGRQGAFDILAAYVRNNPKDARGHLALARLYFVSQSHDKAVEKAREALALDPKLAEGWRILGWELLVSDARADAESAMRQAVALDPKDFRNHVALGDVYAAINRYPEAVAAYRAALTLAPDDANARIMLARALLRSAPDDPKAQAEAEERARQSLAQDDGRAVTHAVFAELFAQRGELATAAQEYETAILLDPNYTDAYYQLAGTYRRLGNLPEAERWGKYHRALTVYALAQMTLSLRLQKATDPDEARRIALELAARAVGARLFRDAAAQYRALLKKAPDPALEKALREVERDPTYVLQTRIQTPTAELLEQGNQYFKASRPGEAFDCYFLAVRRNRYNAGALQSAGLSLVAQGKNEQALLFLTDALKNDPDLPRAHFAVGDIAAAFQRLDEAAGHYRVGLKREETNAEAWYRYGEICRDNQNESDSHAAFERAFLLQPQSPRYARGQADALEERGDVVGAEKVLRAALVVAPDDDETLTQLGALLVERGAADEADPLLRKALARNPKNDYARFQIALIDIRQKRPAPARVALEDLTARNPTAREFWFALGEARRNLGDSAGATKALNQARFLEQRFLLIRSLSERLQKAPKDDETRVRMARLQADAGDATSALINTDIALANQPGRADWQAERNALRQRLSAEKKPIPGAAQLMTLHETIPKAP